MDEDTVKNVIKSRNIIRKKYQAIKSGKMQDASYIEEMFNPIINPLKQIADVSTSDSQESSPIKRRKTSIKEEFKTEGADESYSIKPTLFSPAALSSGKIAKSDDVKLPKNIERELDIQLTDSAKSDDSDSDDIFQERDQTAQFLSSSSPSRNLHQTSQFMDKLKISPKMQDHKYGVRYDVDEKAFKLGNSKITISRDNMFTNNEVYTLTPGLTQLIFSKKPNLSLCTEKDKTNYLQLLQANNVLNRHYDSEQQQAGSKGYKYKVIKLLMDKKRSHTGTGLMQVSKNQTDYVYWNDVNELVDRLKLLIASQQAGHNNHNNEIASILEELKEADIIV